MNRISMLVFLIALGSVISGCVLLEDLNEEPVQFREEFEIIAFQYAGLWYEHARTPNAFQDNQPTIDGTQHGACFNTTAEYGLNSLFKLNVTNRCERESATGEIYVEEIEGIASVIQNSGGRKLNVAFGPPFTRLFQQLLLGANYWIYCIGPVQDGLYNWAVVSGAEKDFIFILTREKFISDELQAEILSCAQSENLPVDELIYQQR